MGDGHHPGCEKARKPDCNCQCGSALHGAAGWIDVSRDTRRRAELRESLVADLRTDSRTGALKRTRENQRTVVNLGRTDIADWLDPSANSAVDPGDTDDIDRVERFATVLADEWRSIAAGIERAVPRSQAKDLRKELARTHAWCGLLTAAADALESMDDIATTVRETLVKNQPFLPAEVAQILAAGFSAAVKYLALGGADLLGGPGSIRALRILAVFCCPDPARHPEVTERALKPLGREIHDILTQETRERLAAVLPDW